MTGNLIIVSAPSGAGKSTLLKAAMQLVDRLVFSVSHTTRGPRSGEQHGRDYYFVTVPEFEKMIADGQFLEWARVHGNYYGTASTPIREQLAQGNDVILDIDVQGAEIIRNSGTVDFTDVFIAPPDMEELERRLRRRGTEDEQNITKRLANAVEEMAQKGTYEHLIVNDQVERGAAQLAEIIVAQRARRRRGDAAQPAAPSGA
ncbi:MAG: guanylate kinase [Desulfofustis sp.]|jgi:guanylate kinase|nr:guanylate kinase [Desulfofustis sp.]